MRPHRLDSLNILRNNLCKCDFLNMAQLSVYLLHRKTKLKYQAKQSSQCV